MVLLWIAQATPGALVTVIVEVMVLKSASHSREQSKATLVYVPLADEASCTVQYYNGQWTHHPQVKLGIASLSASRDLIEQSVRTQLLFLKPNVTITGGAIAESLLWDEQRTRVQGWTLLPWRTICTTAAQAPLSALCGIHGPCSALPEVGGLGMSSRFMQHRLVGGLPHSASLQPSHSRDENVAPRLTYTYMAKLGCPSASLSTRPNAGVRLKDGKEMKADLIVDASGRRSKLPSWLEEAGYQQPAESHVDSHLGYAMRLYELPEKAGITHKP